MSIEADVEAVRDALRTGWRGSNPALAALTRISDRLQRYEAALRLVREAYRPYREDMVMEALAAVDAALDSPATQETGE